MKIEVAPDVARGLPGGLAGLERELNAGVAWLWRQAPRYWHRRRRMWVYGAPRPVMVGGRCRAKLVLRQAGDEKYVLVSLMRPVKTDKYESIAGRIVEDGVEVVAPAPPKA